MHMKITNKTDEQIDTENKKKQKKKQRWIDEGNTHICFNNFVIYNNRNKYG